ncbi:helix-turn-helix domain-containing protein [Amphibiibacter pelophylacis]|uniref:AraC family transcriptional regulator n=1 Tax=Amphibiibacter pelophylacis TaxID=1799477 RepID=A0ACC6P4B2_9BURK
MSLLPPSLLSPLPRQSRPELEQPLTRSTRLGYESLDRAGFIQCLRHGFPTPLARWHYHDEYELHLITASTGQAFVGDWIGPFEPGHLVLAGPRLPHNWVSQNVPPEGYPQRDVVIQFAHEPLAEAAGRMPELAPVMALLERSQRGIEFFGIADQAGPLLDAIVSSSGLRRFGRFCELMALLAEWTDVRLLSSVYLQGSSRDADERISRVIARISRDLSHELSLKSMADEMDMSESQFSRFFRKATGNSFTDFVSSLRIQQACGRLMEGDESITQIAYGVGFNNISNFNRRFLAQKGMTPRAFRQRSQMRFAGRS